MDPGDTIGQPLLVQAVDRLFAGDAVALADLLRRHPMLVRARVASSTGRYCGYFHQATLLHHVAGNARPPAAPANAVEIARLLLDAGAEVDARTVGGPAQPDDPGWTTLGLVATSGDEGIGTQTDALMDLLVERGADVDDADGLPMAGALYYGVAAGARALVRHGARLDLRFAAGLGDVPAMRTFFSADGHPLPGAANGHRYGFGPAPVDEAGVLGEALLFAASSCLADDAEAVRFLLARGADPRAPVAGRTALHEAAFRNHRQIVRLLLDAGADPAAHDDRFHATAEGWARHAGHHACAELIRDRSDTR